MKPLMTALALALAVSGCTNAYDDLAARFETETASGGTSIIVPSAFIISQHRKGAASYRNEISIQIEKTYINVELGAPFTQVLRIPNEEIYACSVTCFGPSDPYVDLFIPSTGSIISFSSTDTLMDWCFNNRKPVLSSETRRAWRNSRTALPPLGDFEKQLGSRVLFDKQASESCMGY